MKASELIQEHTYTDIRNEIVIELQQMNEMTQELIEAIETFQKIVISEITSSASYRFKNSIDRN